MKVKIPFLDLVAPHEKIQEELLAVFRDALKSGRFSGGPVVEAFEAEFAEYCGVTHGIGVANGTDALRFGLMASGIRPGDVVITVPNTFVATTEAITQAGAVPEFVDVDEGTSNLDVEKLGEFLENGVDHDRQSGRPISRRHGRRITAIVPVHLYGQMADMDPILELAEKFELIVVEDACQAHGAEYFSNKSQQWRRAGSMGHAAAFSFYPGKNLGACGEAGAVTTNCESVADRVRMLRDHGQSRKYFHALEGYNGRIDSIQAGILRVKLPFLPEWTERRRRLASRYGQQLSSIQVITLPEEPTWSKSVFHLYVIRVPDRDALQKTLADVGIGTGLHYPLPLHLQEVSSSLVYTRGDYPVAEKLATTLLSLPMYPQMTVCDGDQVCQAVRAHFSVSLGGKLGEVVSGSRWGD